MANVLNEKFIKILELKESMDEAKEKMERQLKRTADDLGLDAGKSIKLEFTSQFGYVFRITLKEEKNIRNSKTYTIIDSNKGGVRFKNEKLDELNTDYLDDWKKYMDEQKSVVSEIMGIACNP